MIQIPAKVTPRRQRGAALAVGLVLLLVLTVLAVSGVITSTFQLRSVANQQQQERAFQAAEVGVERALTQAVASTSVPTVVARTDVDAASPTGDEFAYVIRPLGESDPPSSAPATAVSAGIGLAAFHFEVTAEGFAPGNAESEHTQGFYVIVNTGGTTLPSTGTVLP